MRPAAAIAVLFAFASATSVAQTQSAAGTQTSAVTDSRTVSLVQDGRHDSDADARACLELAGNVAIIKCAEQFRWHKGEHGARR